MMLHWNRGVTWLASSLGTGCFSGGIGGVSVMSRPAQFDLLKLQSVRTGLPAKHLPSALVT